MTTNRTDQPSEPAQPDLAAEFPDWETWGGPLAGILYAKRRDPQMVVRSTTIEGLRAAMERAEKARGLR